MFYMENPNCRVQCHELDERGDKRFKLIIRVYAVPNERYVSAMTSWAGWRQKMLRNPTAS
jgi:hypothetical protein